MCLETLVLRLLTSASVRPACRYRALVTSFSFLEPQLFAIPVVCFVQLAQQQF